MGSYILKAIVFLIAFYAGQSALASPHDKQDEPEKIISRQSLAVYLGITAQDVVFAPPRNFSTEQLNSLELEPMDPLAADTTEELGN